MKKLTLRAVPQVGFGGRINPNGWDVVDEAGAPRGFVALMRRSRDGRFGDDRYWTSGPQIRRRAYATLEVAAIGRQAAR